MLETLTYYAILSFGLAIYCMVVASNS